MRTVVVTQSVILSTSRLPQCLADGSTAVVDGVFFLSKLFMDA